MKASFRQIRRFATAIPQLPPCKFTPPQYKGTFLLYYYIFYKKILYKKKYTDFIMKLIFYKQFQNIFKSLFVKILLNQ